MLNFRNCFTFIYQVIKAQVQRELSHQKDGSASRAEISLEQAVPTSQYNMEEEENIKTKQNFKNLKMTVMNKNKFT